PGLELGLRELALRVTRLHESSAREVGDLAVDHGRRPDGDRQRRAPGTIEVAEGPAVQPARPALERLDELHGPDLRCARAASRREGRLPHFAQADLAGGAAADGADEVAESGVGLDGEELGQRARSDLRDAA